jgi:hypothetical protein
MQETFLRLARNMTALAEVRDLEAYVFTIARNETLRLAAGKGCCGAGCTAGQPFRAHVDTVCLPRCSGVA